MKISAICTDIDGTLLDSRRELSMRTIQAISKVKDSVPVILASSRMPSAMRHLQVELGIESHPLICYNGGFVIKYNGVGGAYEVIESVQINVEIVSAIIEITNALPVHVSLYCNDDWYAREHDQWTEREQRITKASPQFRSFVDVVDAWRGEGLGAHKVMCMGSESDVNLLTVALESAFPGELHLYRSKSTYLEIAPGSISKASGLFQIMKHYYAADLSEVMSFGDNFNDVEMIRMTGLGVAVDNARPQVKEVAREVTLAGRDDGVAIAIEKHFDL